jgi:hypothetical protein
MIVTEWSSHVNVAAKLRTSFLKYCNPFHVSKPAMLVYESILWLSTESCLYVIFVSLVLVFLSYPHQFLVLCRTMMHPRQHLSSQPRAATDIFSELLLVRAPVMLQLLG